MRLLTEWKNGRTAAERKIDSQLLFALDRRLGRQSSALSAIEALALPKEGALEVDIDLAPGVDPGPVVAGIRTLGGTVVSPKSDVPNVGWSACIADPDGNLVGMVQYSEDA